MRARGFRGLGLGFGVKGLRGLGFNQGLDPKQDGKTSGLDGSMGFSKVL